MKMNGDLGHDECMKWCLECDRTTRHITWVRRCSTQATRCTACGREE